MSALSELHKMRQWTLGISVDVLASLAEINARRLGPYLAGGRSLPNTEIERLERTLSDLATLVEVANPWPLAFRDADRIRDLLRRAKLGEFSAREKSVGE
jgi:hypothetical protein